ncbi:Protocadherin-11 X-linked [Vulpes lagopus]
MSQRHVTFNLPEGSQESSSDGALGSHDVGIPSTSYAQHLDYFHNQDFDHIAPNNRTEGDGNSDPES